MMILVQFWIIALKIYKSSDLTHKRAEVLKEAKKGAVVIEKQLTNGDVDLEFVLLLKPTSKEEFKKLYGDL